MRTLLAFLLLTATSFAQTLEVQPGHVISGLKNPQQVGDYIVVDKDSVPKLEQVALVRVKSEANNVIVKVSNLERNTVPVAKIDDRTYVVVGSGKLWVRCVCIDFQKNIYTDEETVVELGNVNPEPLPPAPNPNPNPSPTVPPDAWDNIGQRVATWTLGLPANKDIGQIYLKHANVLRTNPQVTINDESAALTADLSKISNYGMYTAFSTNINEDLKKRWSVSPMSKGVLADYWTAIALGLGVK